MQEKDIRQNMQAREAIIARNVVLSEQEMMKQQEALQKEHQKVLAWEAEAQGEEKEKLIALRRELDRQQQRIAPFAKSLSKSVLKLVPPQTVLKMCSWLLIGGAICLLGQVLKIFLQNGLPDKEAGGKLGLVNFWEPFSLVGHYDKKSCRAGSIVPITGFANSIVASGLEFKHEGYIYGVGLIYLGRRTCFGVRDHGFHW